MAGVRLPFAITVTKGGRKYNFIKGDVVNPARWPEIQKALDKYNRKAKPLESPENKEQKDYETK